jgi:hypothetical protein
LRQRLQYKYGDEYFVLSEQNTLRGFAWNWQTKRLTRFLRGK